jgi:hypothetical protein
MKVVHNRINTAKEKQKPIAVNSLVAGETADDYEKIIRKDRYNKKAYERLMIIYRKNREYAKELKLIDVAIKAFSELYSKSIKRKPDKKTIRLSKALLKMTGLSDNKGNPFYHREPIDKWIKRRSGILSKIKRQK